MRGQRATVHAGERYGRLLVLDEVEPGIPKGSRIFRCRCDCGETWIGTGSTLRKGHTRSCGCLQRERVRDLGLVMGPKTTHGLSRHPGYVAWQSMVRRCHDSKHKDFAHYGARGISVCPRWRDSYAAFLEDMGERPEPGANLHRIDNDGDYELSNCEWLSRSAHTALHMKLRSAK